MLLTKKKWIRSVLNVNASAKDFCLDCIRCIELEIPTGMLLS